MSDVLEQKIEHVLGLAKWRTSVHWEMIQQRVVTLYVQMDSGATVA